MIFPKACERQAIQLKKRCRKTRTKLQPIDVKKPAVPLIARDRTDDKMTSKIASNAVFSASERLLLTRTIRSATRKMITPRRETCMKVSSFGSIPRPRSRAVKSDKAFITTTDRGEKARRAYLLSEMKEKKSDRMPSFVLL